MAITVAIVGACIRGPLWGLLNFWIFSHLIRWTGGWIGGVHTRMPRRALKREAAGLKNPNTIVAPGKV